MNDRSVQTARNHNTVVGIITIASFGTISGSIALHWEPWVPPLIVIGLIATWVLHLTQHGTRTFRENYYLIFTMLLSFYHGIHQTSYYEIVVVSALLMVNVTLFQRREFITLMLAECIMLIVIHIIWGYRTGYIEFDTLFVSKTALHVIAEFCIFKGLNDAIRNSSRDSEELEHRNEEKEKARTEMEDFLVNISHELRTPVNVINGMSTLILKKEDRDDVVAIRDAGLRLSSQIEDIQDYSEIQRGDVILEEDRYMISSVLNDIIAGYSVWEMRKDLELVVDLDPNVPSVMFGDSRKISKIITHLLDNAMKFTRRGGVYLKVSTVKREYGVNLLIEVTDTGIGMSRSEIEKLSKGIFQANKKRNRSTGGIGLGLSIVYGFARKMGGFVGIDSNKGKGTTVHVSLAQKVIDYTPCISVQNKRFVNIVFHVDPDKYTVPMIGEFYRQMASNMAAGLRLNLYSAPSLNELKRLMEKGDITHVFMGPDEYEQAPEYFDELAKGDVTLAVSAPEGFTLKPFSRVILMPRPLFGCSVVKVLNGDASVLLIPSAESEARPVFDGIRALVVDDEPMNLVVATGLFKDYNMIIDTADSGRESIDKFASGSYDVVFMDHMMPEMDGVEAMKHIKEVAMQQGKTARVIALTANAISGAREMFLKEGFDGFISKPINIYEFERVMTRVLSGGRVSQTEVPNDKVH